MLILIGQDKFARLVESLVGDQPQLQHIPTAALLNGTVLPLPPQGQQASLTHHHQAYVTKIMQYGFSLSLTPQQNVRMARMFQVCTQIHASLPEFAESNGF